MDISAEILDYPFDGSLILKKRRALRRILLADGSSRIKKNIAFLGGSTTQDIAAITELFLLKNGIEPAIYQSEYGRYWEDVLFDNGELDDFSPDVIVVHTSIHNITHYPDVVDGDKEVQQALNETFEHFRMLWEAAEQKYHCTIIQNNFEMPSYRLLGNQDCVDMRGRTRFIMRLNEMFADYASKASHLYINDVCWLSAQYGLQSWQNPFYWHMYKYALCVEAIPEFSYNLSNIIKALYGKSKKVLTLDLDNTLWGGVVGDDGVEGIEIGHETSRGQIYESFQTYLKQLKGIGVALAVNSKNDLENALAGLNHPASILKPEDFVDIEANWEPKDRNIRSIATNINVGTDSIVLADDNPAERQIVRASMPEVEAPALDDPLLFERVIDRSGYFEVVALSSDDIERNKMYQENAKRAQAQASFVDYDEYLRSLDMHATVRPFDDVSLARIAQLTNKTNQFNLTTRRYTLAEISAAAADDNCVTLYARLADKFGDNGIVSVVLGHQEQDTLIIDLWLMSCRVLKRDLEQVLMDRLVEVCRERSIRQIVGTYLPTKKNGMVSGFFGEMGFEKISEEDGATQWRLADLDAYQPKNKTITVE